VQLSRKMGERRVQPLKSADRILLGKKVLKREGEGLKWNSPSSWWKKLSAQRNAATIRIRSIGEGGAGTPNEDCPWYSRTSKKKEGKPAQKTKSPRPTLRTDNSPAPKAGRPPDQGPDMMNEQPIQGGKRHVLPVEGELLVTDRKRETGGRKPRG